METVVQFLRPDDAFMARGQQHTIRHVIRKGAERTVLVIGERADGGYFEAEFPWGDSVDTLTGTL